MDLQSHVWNVAFRKSMYWVNFRHNYRRHWHLTKSGIYARQGFGSSCYCSCWILSWISVKMIDLCNGLRVRQVLTRQKKLLKYCQKLPFCRQQAILIQEWTLRSKFNDWWSRYFSEKSLVLYSMKYIQNMDKLLRGINRNQDWSCSFMIKSAV